MKTIEFSVDRCEWTRTHYMIEVEDDATKDDIQDQAISDIEEHIAVPLGNEFIGPNDMVDNEYIFPWDLDKESKDLT